MNVCENAYRTHRLRERSGPEEASAARAEITFVLTAHPTESRSPANIRLLRRVQDHVVRSLERGRPVDRREFGHLIHLAWRVGTHPPEKPSVEDEANHLFSLLTDPILAEVTPYRGVGELAREPADASRAAFEDRVASGAFRRLLERATPYGRLQALTIGSRPSVKHRGAARVAREARGGGGRQTAGTRQEVFRHGPLRLSL